MRSVNKVILIGNLTREPEIRETPNGQSVTTFGIATNRQWVTKGSEKKSSAEFHECVAWARLAEICANFLKKGHLVYVEGYLKTRSWDTPEGVKKFKTEVVVQDMILLEKRNNSDEDIDYIPSTNDDLPAADYMQEAPSVETPEKVSQETKVQAPIEEPETAPEPPVETHAEEATPVQEVSYEQPAEKSAEENLIDKDLGL